MAACNCRFHPMTARCASGAIRLWQDLASGSTYTMPHGTLGYEWDEDIDNGSRPAGLIHLSTSHAHLTSDLLLDAGSDLWSRERCPSHDAVPRAERSVGLR